MPQEGNHRTSYGAYGFRLVPTEPGVRLPHLPRAEEGAAAIEFSWRHATALHDAREVTPEHMRMSYQRGGSMVATRDPAAVVLDVPQPLPIAAIVHPVATLPLSVFARWHGHMTLHGGVFLNSGVAWAVCGDQTAGKSSALALLGRLGVPILCDDLVVIAGHDVLCGPRCVDLRPDVAARFPDAEPLGMVGSRERFRLPTAEAPPRAPLGGIVLLEWGSGPEIEAEPLGTQERLELLYKQQYSTMFDPDERGVMRLLDTPMLRFRRPRDWDRAEEATARLLAATAQ